MSFRQSFRTVVVLVATAVAPSVVTAEHSTTLQKLCTGSSTIVVGQIKDVVDVAGARVAVVSVEETWKGRPTRELAFPEQGTWTCHSSGAEIGERAVFFFIEYEFDPGADSLPPVQSVCQPMFKEPAGFRQGVEAIGLRWPLQAVYWSWRGEMRIQTIDAHEYVTLFVDDVPSYVPSIDGPEKEYAELERSVCLDDLRRLVLALMATGE